MVDKSNDIRLVRRRNLLEDKTLIEECQILFEVELLSKILAMKDL